MHEVSLVAELVDLCVNRARETGHPVATVQIRFATTIPEQVLRQAFTMLTRDTPLAGATLEADPFDSVLDCPHCDFIGALSHDDLVGGMAICPACDEPSPTPHTAELELVALA